MQKCFLVERKAERCYIQYQTLLLLISSVEQIAGMDSISISRSIRTITQAARHNGASQVFNMSNITMHAGEGDLTYPLYPASALMKSSSLRCETEEKQCVQLNPICQELTQSCPASARHHFDCQQCLLFIAVTFATFTSICNIWKRY